MPDVHLFDAVRTPRGKGRPDGALAGVPPWELVGQLVQALRLRHAAGALEAVERLALGCVTQAGVQGGHLALLAREHAGLPDGAVAVTLDNYCVSGMSALAAAARAIATGEERLALAGGVESMSQAPFESDAAPFYRDAALAARFRYVPPPVVADWLATREGLTREELDAVTVESHRRAGRAWDEGRYASTVVPVKRPDGTGVERDELVRPALGVADLARFGPAFAALGAMGAETFIAGVDPALGGLDYLHAVPHCPPVADGAALLLLGSRERGAELGLAPRRRAARGGRRHRVHGGLRRRARDLPPQAARGRRARQRERRSPRHGPPDGGLGRDPRRHAARGDGAQGRRVGRGRGPRRLGRGLRRAAAARVRPTRARAAA